MYRTFIALFVSVAAVALYDWASRANPFLDAIAPYVCIAGLLALYLLSYRKQTEYINKRIEANKP